MKDLHKSIVEDLKRKYNASKSIREMEEDSSISSRGAEYLGSRRGYDVYYINEWEAGRSLGEGAEWSPFTENGLSSWRLYKSRGAEFYFFIGRSPRDKYALIVYPDSLRYKSGEIFKDARQGEYYKIVKTNFELYDLKGNLDYTYIDELPSDLIPEIIDLDIDQVKALGDDQELYIDSENRLVKAEKDISGDVIIPDGVTSIDAAAFYGCSSLTSVTIPNSVTFIGKGAFSQCANLTQARLSSNITDINDYTFSGCKNLVDITIPDGVVSIGNSAFSGCESLTDIAIPDSVVNVGENAFSRCYQLMHVNMSNNMRSVGEGAFLHCTSLISIAIPRSVAYIKESTFNGCSSLTDITLSDGVKNIGEFAFGHCESLINITIPSSVIGIGNYAFYYCKKLKSIVIPNSVSRIGKGAFKDCTRLTIYCGAKFKPDRWHLQWNQSNCPFVWGYKSRVDESLDKSSSRFHAFSLKEAKEDREKLINFAGQELADKFFKYKDRLKVEERDLYYWLKKDVKELENRISEIENTRTKSQLKRSINQEGAKYLGSGKDYDVYHITTWEASRNLGRNTKWCISMENNPNYWKSYTKRGVKFYFFIGKNPSDKYALALYPKILRSGKGEVIEDERSGNWYEIFEVNYELYNSEDKLSYQDVNKLPLDLIPEKIYSDIKQLKGSGENQEFLIDDGKLIKVNKNISGDVVIPNNVTSIGNSAFFDCRELKGVTIPDSVASIGMGAFWNCKGLTSVTIGNSVTSIGERAFNGCSGLTSIAIPDSVTSIGDSAFQHCSSLTDITIPDSVKSTGSFTFAQCTGLTSATIGNSVTRIGYGMFNNCSGLTSITIGNNVTSIDNRVFAGCNGLTSITIPDSVTSIGDSAFSDCSGLTSITIPDNVTSIGEDAFFNCSELTIYCEAKKQPEGWNKDWNFSDRPVIWGYKA